MKINTEWHIYNPADPQKHPESIALVEIELEDGGTLNVIYSDGGAIFSRASGARILGEIKRWRYTGEMPKQSPGK